MLKRTFLHIPGIGEATERKLWASGIQCWEDFLDGRGGPGLSCQVKRLLDGSVRESVRSLERGDAAYFERLLPGSEQWRLYPDFHGGVAFLDIETTGLGPGSDCITVIGMYDGRRTKVFVRGKNMHEFPDEVRKYSLLVTYNGRQFDLPFIRHAFGQLPYGQGHIDLRYPLRALGYSGGLKKIERVMGLERLGALRNVDGYIAVLLWREYQAGNRKALETLVRYNLEDVVNLRYLAEVTYNLAVSRLPISVKAIDVRPAHEVDLPYEVDAALVRRLRPWAFA